MIGCSSSTPTENEVQDDKGITRIISFSGLDWVVRNTEGKREGPGPNLFSDSSKNVWVDESGSLHLKITHENHEWYCAEVTLRQSYGYKKYVFYLSDKTKEIDQNIVVGLFIYKNDEEEIDIEFSKWSKADNKMAQYAVQPAEKMGNKKRFAWTDWSAPSIHLFNWRKDSIEFASFDGHTSAGDSKDTISSWVYAGDNIPSENNEKLKINLWLFRGAPSANQKTVEIVIDSVAIL